MKNYEIINNLNNIDAISNVVFPIKISYVIKKNLKTLISEYEVYHELLKDLKAKHDEASDEYKEKLNDLLHIEAELDIMPIKEGDLLESGIDISIKDLELLDFMIK